MTAAGGLARHLRIDDDQRSMPCYLCAYQDTNQPKYPRGLPAGSPASPTDPLGACTQCNVLACSGHSSFAMQFFCAMCLAAAAIQAVVNPTGAGASPPSAEAAKALARRVGLEGEDHWEGVRRALELIARDAGPAARAAAGETNLVWDFAGAIQPSVHPTSREAAEPPPRWVIPAVRNPDRAPVMVSAKRPVELSLDAVGAGIRGLFAEQARTSFDEDDVLVVTGALVMALTVADDPGAADSDGDPEVDPAQVEIRRPWAVSHPVLLSPSAWLVAEAYHRAR